MVFRGDGRLKFCKTCGLLDVVQSVCRLYKKIVNPEVDYCSEHNENPPKLANIVKDMCLTKH